MHNNLYPQRSPDAHQQAREAMPEYAAQRALGQQPDQAPPELARHIGACAACRGELDELVELTDTAYAGRLERAASYPRPNLSFLSAPAPAEQPGLLDQIGRVVIAFSEALLASLQAPTLAGALRGQLLYRYTQGGGSHNIDVTVEVFSEDAARERGRLQIMVELLDHDPLDQSGSRVIVQTGDAAWTGATDETGCVSFAGIPLRALPRLRVEVVPKTT